MPFLTSPDGVRLHYEVEGDGPAVVLHLGAGCDASLWRAAGYVDALTLQNTCVLFDHRGHGLSDNPSEVAAHHIDRYADDVVALLDHLSIDSAHFYGWSNAMFVGCAVARQAPDRVRSLVLSGTVAKPGTREDLEKSVQQRVSDLEAEGWDFLINGFAEDEGQCPDWMQGRIRATNLRQLICWQQARLDWPITPWELVVDLEHPTLLIVGDLEDPEHLISEAAAQMKDATEVRIEGAGHIKAFLASEKALPHVKPFLTAH